MSSGKIRIHWDISLCDQIQGNANVVANALSRAYALFSSFQSKLLRFEFIKDLHEKDYDFGQVWNDSCKCAYGDFYRHHGFVQER